MCGQVSSGSSKMNSPKKTKDNAKSGRYKLRLVDGVIHSSFPDVDLPEMPLTDYVMKDFDKFGDRPALIDSVTGKVYTFPEVRAAVQRVSSGLTRHGVRKGDVVMFVSANSCEYIIMYHAVISLGAICTFISPISPVESIKNQSEDSGAKFFFVDKERLENFKAVRDALGNVKKTFVTGDYEAEEGCVSFSDLLSDDGTARPDKVDIDVHNDVIMLPYSSGTTGLCKGVRIHHFSTVSNIQQFDVPEFWAEREGAVHLAILPFYHLFALYINFNVALALGQTSVVAPRFEPEPFLKLISEYKVSLLVIVPPIAVFMTKSPLTKKYDLSSVKRALIAAAPLSPEVADDFQKICPQACIGQGYGMTETGPVITFNPVRDCARKPASVGLVVPNTQVKFVDTETKKVCGPNHNGEVWTRGPQNMLGYLNKPEATANTIDKEGFLHTGDIGYFDKEGHIYIVDRVKELIKYKGFQVPPAELEALLLTHPDVADAGVTAVPDEEAGELPKGYVVLKEGASATPSEIQEYVAGNIVATKKLRGGVEFLPAIPKSATGKILRRELKRMAIEKLEQERTAK